MLLIDQSWSNSRKEKYAVHCQTYRGSVAFFPLLLLLTIIACRANTILSRCSFSFCSGGKSWLQKVAKTKKQGLIQRQRFQDGHQIAPVGQHKKVGPCTQSWTIDWPPPFFFLSPDSDQSTGHNIVHFSPDQSLPPTHFRTSKLQKRSRPFQSGINFGLVYESGNGHRASKLFSFF
jgi:hypothetical protein